MRIRLPALAHAALTAALFSQAPPPMFGPWYGESLRGILDLEEADAARLERQLTSNPEDPAARLKLMAYYARADRVTHPEDRAMRVRHALWLVGHHPDSEILHSYVSHFSGRDLTTDDYQRAVALWEAASRSRPRDAAVAWNAASFFQGLDPERYLHYLEATAAADPNHRYAIRPLADLYALSILEGGPLTARAQAGLDASHNMWVLSNAAYMFQSQYNLSVQRGSPNARAADLAERYFVRAQALDPSLDRQKILPRLDSQGLHPVPDSQQRGVSDASVEIRRLPIESFPGLPPAIAGVLRARHCQVPQPSSTGPRRNVVRGEFFARGEAGWAVLCSVNNRTSLLAFRNHRDTNPDTVTTAEDRNYVRSMADGFFGYSREITSVGREFILRHYRAYGGPEPPPIDHQGIDDAFLEKASVTWYFYQGKWLTLQGAD